MAAAFGLEPGQAIVEAKPDRVWRLGSKAWLPVAVVGTFGLVWSAIPVSPRPTTPADELVHRLAHRPDGAPAKAQASIRTAPAAMRIGSATPAAVAMRVLADDAAPLLTIIQFRAGSRPAQSWASGLAQRLQGDPAVAGLQVIGVADPGPRGIYYVFAEDYPTAKTLTARLGPGFGPPRQLAAGRNVVPGTVVVVLP